MIGIRIKRNRGITAPQFIRTALPPARRTRSPLPRRQPHLCQKPWSLPFAPSTRKQRAKGTLLFISNCREAVLFNDQDHPPEWARLTSISAKNPPPIPVGCIGFICNSMSRVTLRGKHCPTETTATFAIILETVLFVGGWFPIHLPTSLAKRAHLSVFGYRR